MFEEVNLLVSCFKIGKASIGQLIAMKAQLIAQADALSFALANYIESIINMFSMN